MAHCDRCESRKKLIFSTNNYGRKTIIILYIIRNTLQLEMFYRIRQYGS